MKYEPYNSFLVRFWQIHERGGAEASWRGEVESIQTGQTWQFTGPETMFRFLLGRMEKMTPHSGDTNDEH